MTLKVDEFLAFPDGVSERAQKHVHELIKLREQGYGAEIMFICQREDAKKFRPAKEFDPEYAVLLKTAAQKGVQVSAMEARVGPQGIEIQKQPLFVDLSL